MTSVKRIIQQACKPFRVVATQQEKYVTILGNLKSRVRVRRVSRKIFFGRLGRTGKMNLNSGYDFVSCYRYIVFFFA